jgi:hypothetical protein
MSTNGLLGSDVVYKCLGDSETALFLWTAAGTGATLLDRAEVICELPVAQFQSTGGDNSIAETLIANQYKLLWVMIRTYRCPCWPHAIEHIGTKRYCYNDIFGVSLDGISKNQLERMSENIPRP